ncbi:uncharacterized protein UMAG_10078 [Mycosarcoma maydis]|uniref:Uncharacterized protein n=1 Tax=Mycosarcoma maydis TaxID=5270 RepID=A0A0D1CT71_MYCMD|nr:uncharacterized protein UMAG_10078 [Ustilago maydis 521]KIS69713.1 hypothetical protein UMAG_10078 [Ustilago maydis 521]|eukprot:XP_011388805.1 hypothetical protein UMAG_10078 [Ustilago maydis 521]
MRDQNSQDEVASARVEDRGRDRRWTLTACYRDWTRLDRLGNRSELALDPDLVHVRVHRCRHDRLLLDVHGALDDANLVLWLVDLVSSSLAALMTCEQASGQSRSCLAIPVLKRARLQCDVMLPHRAVYLGYGVLVCGVR